MAGELAVIKKVINVMGYIDIPYELTITSSIKVPGFMRLKIGDELNTSSIMMIMENSDIVCIPLSGEFDFDKRYYVYKFNNNCVVFTEKL